MRFDRLKWFDCLALTSLFVAFMLYFATQNSPKLRDSRLSARVPRWLMIIALAIASLLVAIAVGRLS